ncbi:hypothetical protein IFM89_023954 [Coptis chinensis]|uniref:Uncharacterized protein n=1 Tax=Coptis chinensis TaxID=261450 RepID=A0A835HM54_9MAGN|nr:hypothetical protein IFM89_023954 [Coptis chinensis]
MTADHLESGLTDLRIEQLTKESSLVDDAWIQLEPLSTTNFSWEDPYGKKMIDTKVQSGSITVVHQLNLTRMEKSSSEESALEMKFHVVEIGDLIIARFTEDVPSQSGYLEGSLPRLSLKTSCMPSKMQNDTAPSPITGDSALMNPNYFLGGQRAKVTLVLLMLPFWLKSLLKVNDLKLDSPVVGSRGLGVLKRKNTHHRRSVAASLVQGVYVLEQDRQENCQGPHALAS